MAVTKQQLAQWSREFSAKNPDKVSGAGSTAQNITTKKNSITKEQLSQWSREFDKKEAQRQAEQEQNTRDKALQQYAERHISDMGEVDARNEPSQALRASSPRVGNGDDCSGADRCQRQMKGGEARAAFCFFKVPAKGLKKKQQTQPERQWRIEGGAVGAAASRMQATAKQTLGAATRAQSATGVSGKFPLDAGSSAGRKMAGAATEDGGSGRAQELRASFAKDSVPDEFDRINQWLDTGDNKNLADAVRRVDNTHGAYTDADLGWRRCSAWPSAPANTADSSAGPSLMRPSAR